MLRNYKIINNHRWYFVIFASEEVSTYADPSSILGPPSFIPARTGLWRAWVFDRSMSSIDSS